MFKPRISVPETLSLFDFDSSLQCASLCSDSFLPRKPRTPVAPAAVPKSFLRQIGDQYAQKNLLGDPGTVDFQKPESKSVIFDQPYEDELNRALQISHLNDEDLNSENVAGFEDSNFIQYLHRKSLEENLSLLLSTDNKSYVWKEKAEVLQWIFAEDVINGRNVRSIPFSFVNCCICSGVDSDVFRAGLLSVEVVRQLLLSFKMVSQSELPKVRTASVSSSSPDVQFAEARSYACADHHIWTHLQDDDLLLEEVADCYMFHPNKKTQKPVLKDEQKKNSTR